MRNFATVMSCFCEHIVVCEGCFCKENQRSSGNTNTVWTELPKVAPVIPLAGSLKDTVCSEGL